MRSREHDRWLDGLWAAFAVLNFVLLPSFGEWGTVPFHFVWVSLTLLYGLRVWSLKPTLIVLLVVSGISTAELAWLASGGESSWAEVIEVPLMAGMFLAMVWHARRRQNALARVQSSAERERNFIRDASHELRTPITIARGHAELIRTAHLTSRAREDAQVILEELERLGAISDALLLLATSEIPGFISPSSVDLEWFLVTAARRWTGTASRRWNIEALMGGSVVVDGDRMASALDALIENAVAFTEEHDSISVTGFTQGDRTVIEVADTGRGIPADRIDRIFERFATFNDLRALGGAGNGLGLAIAKTIIEAHGGTISVVSELGRGTTFTIRLPSHAADSAKPTADPTRRYDRVDSVLRVHPGMSRVTG